MLTCVNTESDPRIKGIGFHWYSCNSMQRLLTVDDVFEIGGRGVLLTPLFPALLLDATKATVELRLPDGSRRKLIAYFAIPRITTGATKGVQLACELPGLTKADVPVGTEVWASRTLRPAKKSVKRAG